MAFYNASLSGGGSGSAIACPLGKLVADGSVNESTLPYNFYKGSAVVYNNEIHILGSADSSNYTKYYKNINKIELKAINIKNISSSINLDVVDKSTYNTHIEEFNNFINDLITNEQIDNIIDTLE